MGQYSRKLFGMIATVNSIALAGLTAATQRFSAHAQNIANQQSEGFRPVTAEQTTQETGAPVVRVRQAPPEQAQQRLQGTDFVVPQSDLATEMVGIIESETAYKASAKLLKSAQDMDQALFDVLG